MDLVRNHIGHDLKYSSIYFILKSIHLKRLYLFKTAKKLKKPSFSLALQIKHFDCFKIDCFLQTYCYEIESMCDAQIHCDVIDKMPF